MSTAKTKQASVTNPDEQLSQQWSYRERALLYETSSKEQATARIPAHPAHPDPTSMASLAQALAALPVHNWVRAEPMHNWVRGELVAPPKSPAPPPSPPSPRPPATLVLSGELTDQGSCLGVYSLLDVQVHGGEHPYEVEEAMRRRTRVFAPCERPLGSCTTEVFQP